jgi:hypothetical protein
MTVIQEATNDLGRPHFHGPNRLRDEAGAVMECRRCEAVAFLTGSTPAWRVARDVFFVAAGLDTPATDVITRLVDVHETRWDRLAAGLKAPA